MGARMLQASGSSPRCATRRRSGAGRTASRSSSRTPSCGATSATLLGAVRDIERILARVGDEPGERARPALARHEPRAAARDARACSALAYSTTLTELGESDRPLRRPEGRCSARAIADDPPPTIKDGGMIRAGFDAELDELRGLSRTGKDWIAAYQAREAERTGIPSLKVGYNRVFGYYDRDHEAAPREGAARSTCAARRSPTASATSPTKLRRYEEKVLGADERAKELEVPALPGRARRRRGAHPGAPAPRRGASPSSTCCASLAEAAAAGGWVRPEIPDDRTLSLMRRAPPGRRAPPAGGRALRAQRRRARRRACGSRSSRARTWRARAPTSARPRSSC